MLNLIVAPKEYCSAGEKIAKSVVKKLKAEKIEYSVYFSKSLDHVAENVKLLQTMAETEFVVIGDDVVLHRVVNAVKDVTKVKIGIVPTSKHDDFATFLGLPVTASGAIENILAGEVQAVDYLMLNDKRVVNNVIVGAEVEFLEHYNAYKLKNVISHRIATEKYAVKFDGIDLGLELKQNKVSTERVFNLVVANGGNCRGKQISPLSNVQDGLLNVCYSTACTTEEKRKFTKSFVKGKHIYDDSTKQHWLPSLKISNADKNIKAMVDGEIESFENMNFVVIEGGLKIFNAIK